MLSLLREKIYEGLRPRPITNMYGFDKGLGLRQYAIKRLEGLRTTPATKPKASVPSTSTGVTVDTTSKPVVLLKYKR